MRYAELGLSVDAERARAFVLAHGGALQQARLAGIFGVPAAGKEVARALEVSQHADGGFAAGMAAGAQGSIDTTCAVLAQLKDLPPLAGSPMASRALSFLRRSQLTNGSWQEAPAPGEASLTAPVPDGAYLTALATYTLLSMEPEHLDPVVRGEAWVRKELGGGDCTASTRTLALAAAIWFRLPCSGAQEVASAYSELARRRLTPAELAWWLTAALETGVAGRYLLPLVGLLRDLAAAQRVDGSWVDEPGSAVETTLQALRVFRSCGIL